MDKWRTLSIKIIFVLLTNWRKSFLWSAHRITLLKKITIVFCCYFQLKVLTLLQSLSKKNIKNLQVFTKVGLIKKLIQRISTFTEDVVAGRVLLYFMFLGFSYYCGFVLKFCPVYFGFCLSESSNHLLVFF